jgi:diamine N-acetyltransferase
MYIRRATLDDVNLISSLGATTFDQAFRGTCTDKDLEGILNEYYNEEQVKKELEDANDYFFILFDNEVAAGYTRINLGRTADENFNYKKSAELMRIYFLEQFHGKGLAARLLSYCCDFLKEKKYEQVYLSVWEHNERAKAFYLKHGFINTNIQNPFPLGETPQMDYWFLKQL